jgi:hypothetical protein
VHPVITHWLAAERVKDLLQDARRARVLAHARAGRHNAQTTTRSESAARRSDRRRALSPKLPASEGAQAS